MFTTGNREGYRAARVDVRKAVVDCKEWYKPRVGQHFGNCDIKSGWAGLQFNSGLQFNYGYKKKQLVPPQGDVAERTAALSTFSTAALRKLTRDYPQLSAGIQHLLLSRSASSKANRPAKHAQGPDGIERKVL